MAVLEYISKLVNDQYNGDPWIGVSISETLKGVDAAMAAQNIHGLNSIWQIVQHMVCWRETLLRRLEGQDAPSPADNFIVHVTDPSDHAWKLVLQRLQTSQDSINNFLLEGVTNLYEPPAGSDYTRYELMEAILQHDAYHLGQIVIIKKMLQA